MRQESATLHHVDSASAIEQESYLLKKKWEKVYSPSSCFGTEFVWVAPWGSWFRFMQVAVKVQRRRDEYNSANAAQ